MNAIVYLSESTIEFTENDLKKLTLFSESRNKEAKITGYLAYQEGRFIQYIEGEESEIQALMESIEKDNRHRVMYKLQKNNVKMRFFPSWDMRLIREEEINRLQLDTLIEQNFIIIKKEFPNKEYYEKLLWKHVKLISRIRAI